MKKSNKLVKKFLVSSKICKMDNISVPIHVLKNAKLKLESNSKMIEEKWFLSEVRGSIPSPGRILINSENDENRLMDF